MNFVQAFFLCLTIVVLAYPIEFADAATSDDQIFQTKEKPSISSLASLPENVHSFSTEAAGKNNTSFGNSNSTTDDNESESVKALNLRIPGLFASKLLQHAAIQQRQQQLAMNEVAQLSQVSQIHQLLQQQATRIARLRSMLRRCQSRHIERESFETDHQQQKKKHQMSAAPAPANQKEKKKYKDEQQHGATLPRPRHGKQQQQQQQQQRLQQKAAAAAAKKKAQMEREKRLRKPQEEEARERSVEEFEKRKSRIRNENYENEQQQQRQWQPLYKSQAKKAHSQHKAPLPAPPLASSPQNKQPVVVVPRPKPIYTKSRHASHHKPRPPSPPPPPHLPESQSPPLPFPKVVSRKPMANPVSRKKLTRPTPPPVYTPGEPQAKRPQFQERTRFLSLSNNSASSEYYYDDSDYYDESDYVDYGDYDNYVDDHNNQLQSLSAEETTTETAATYVKKEVSTSTSSTADLDETSTRRVGRQSRRRYRSTTAEENEEIIKLTGSYYDKYDENAELLRRPGSTLFEESLSERLGARGLVKGKLIILSNFNNNLNLYKNKISLADLCRLIKKKRGYLKREDLVEYGYGGGQKEQSYNKADYKKRGEYSRKLSNGKYYDKYEEKEEPLRFRYLRTEDSVVVIIQNKDGNINQEVKKILGYKTGLNIKVDNPDIELPIEFLRDEEIDALLEKAIIINNDNNNNNF